MDVVTRRPAVSAALWSPLHHSVLSEDPIELKKVIYKEVRRGWERNGETRKDTQSVSVG